MEKDAFNGYIGALEANLADQKRRMVKSVADELAAKPSPERLLQEADKTAERERVSNEVISELAERFPGLAEKLGKAGFVIPLFRDLVTPKTPIPVKIVKVRVTEKMTLKYAQKINQEVGGKLPDSVFIKGLYYWNRNVEMPRRREGYRAEEACQDWIYWMGNQPGHNKSLLTRSLGRLYHAIEAVSSDQVPFYPDISTIRTLDDFRERVKADITLFPEGIMQTVVFLRDAFRKTTKAQS